MSKLNAGVGSIITKLEEHRAASQDDVRRVEQERDAAVQEALAHARSIVARLREAISEGEHPLTVEATAEVFKSAYASTKLGVLPPMAAEVTLAVRVPHPDFLLEERLVIGIEIVHQTRRYTVSILNELDREVQSRHKFPRKGSIVQPHHPDEDFIRLHEQIVQSEARYLAQNRSVIELAEARSSLVL